MLFRDLKIRTKYPLVIVALALLAAFATGFVAYTHSDREMRAAAELKLLALLESRKAALDSYFTSIREDLRFQSESRLVIDAIGAFSWNWKALGEGQTDRLQRLYITDNPYPTGEKESMDSANDESAYSSAHQQYHPEFRKFRRQRGYYDIFLFDPDGNLIYTVVKGRDYATNLVTGEWKTTDLGKAFRATRFIPKSGFMVFFDFRFYQPSFEAPASFISTPVFNAVGTFIGVLAFQMPIGRLNKVMQVTAGMGKTGETYVVGQDLLMRSDSRFSEESTILNTRVDTVTVRKALNGETGVELTLDYRGVPVLSAYAPQEFLGVRWAIMAEVDEAEVLAPVHKMRDFMLIGGAVITVVIAAIGYFLATALSRPIVVMTDAMARLARRELEIEIPSLNRGDEIGEMASALKVFQENAVERKRAEEELRKSQETMRALADNLPEFITLKDPDGRFLFVNKRFEEWVGLEQHDVVGKTVHDIFPPEQTVEFDALDRKVMTDQSVLSREVDIHYPNGNTRTVISTRFPVVSSSGETIGLGTVNIDITEHKRVEEALEAKEAQLRFAFDNMRGGIFMVDKDLNLQVFSESFAKYYKFPNRLLRKGESLIPLIEFRAKRGDYGPGDPAELVRTRIEGYRSFEERRVEDRIPGGRIVERFRTATEDGGVVTVFNDITERKQAQETLRDSEERLKVQVVDLRDREERLEAQAADLVALAEDQAIMSDELKKLNDQKDKFFSIIAHDLKGPFTALLGYSSLLADKVDYFDKKGVVESAAAVHESAQRVFKLLENLLEWSRLQMGQLEFEPGPIDLKEIIDTNLGLFAPTAKEKAIRLTGKRRKPLNVFADAHMVDAVVRNLVNNAIKFTPERGHVTISARRNGKWAEVEVSDTGVGISAYRAARLFRLDEKTSTVGTGGETGTGLGLHLCKELVERQGGRIQVRSTEGEGSVFRFTLPLHQQ